MKITLTGSLGHISKPLTKELVQQGHTVTVISSTSERQEAIEAMGARAAIGSVDDANFLISTFNGADAVYCMIPPNYFDEPDIIAYYKRIGKNYARAIQSSGVKRVVHLSSFGAHLDEGTGPILGSHHVEHLFNDLSGIALTHMRPTSFYYNLFGFMDTIKARDAILANYGKDKVPMVSPRDIAVAIAKEIVETTDTTDIRYVCSDERTGPEIAAVLGRAIGKPDLQWQLISDEQMKGALKDVGLNEELASKLTELYVSIRTGKLAEDYNKHKPDLTGKVKMEDFAKEFAVVYHQN